MKNHAHLLPVLFLLLAAALGLSACGSPAPVRVYVTPTPLPAPTAAARLTSGGGSAALVPANRYVDTTPLPTPQPPPPGVNYGPIVGPNYTPEPLHTALPPTVSVQPCRVIVTAPQVTIYQQADKTSAVTGSASEREKLAVRQVTTDAAGNQWANTMEGWLTLTDGGTQTAQLDSLRQCDVLTGKQPDTTLMGLHVLNGTSYNAVITFVQQMLAAGHPVGTIEGLNGSEQLLNEIKRISPQTVIVYRSLLTSDGMLDCPGDIRQLPDPAKTAQRWMAGLKPYWDQVSADYYELMNECPAPLSWIAQFSIESMRLANEQGRCLLLFSFPGGNPDMQTFDDLLPAYQYMLDHPCQPGRTHGVALHSWSLDDHQLASESDVWVVFRHRIIHDRLLLKLPAAANLPVYITEMGIGGGTILPPCDTVVRDALQFSYQVEEDPYVKGVHLWNVGTGGQWYDITACLPALADALIRYYGG